MDDSSRLVDELVSHAQDCGLVNKLGGSVVPTKLDALKDTIKRKLSNIDRLIDENARLRKWHRPSECLPEPYPKYPNSDIPCLVIYHGEQRILQYSPYHKCWDDESGDDFFCKIEEVEYWRPLPEMPE